MKKAIRFIIKFGQLEHMKAFLTTGEMYFNVVEFFKQKDSNAERFDPLESAVEIDQVTWLKIENEKGEVMEFSTHDPALVHLSSAYLLTHSDEPKGNIYSCTAVAVDERKNFKKIDPRFRNFGDTVVLINKIGVFIDRLESELKNRNFQYVLGLVDYFDHNTMVGPLHVFKKKKEHEYQSELRFWIDNSENVPIIIKIGSIEDIASLMNIEDFINLSTTMQ